jgi:hypothetical protein
MIQKKMEKANICFLQFIAGISPTLEASGARKILKHGLRNTPFLSHSLLR